MAENTSQYLKEELMLDVADSYDSSTFSSALYLGRNIPSKVLEANCKYLDHTIEEETPLALKDDGMLITTRGIYIKKARLVDKNSTNGNVYEWKDIESLSLSRGTGLLSVDSLVINEKTFAFFSTGKWEGLCLNSLLQDIHSITQLQSVDGLTAIQLSSVESPRWLLRNGDRVYRISSQKELSSALTSWSADEQVTNSWDYKDLTENDQDWKPVGRKLYEQLNLSYSKSMYKRKLFFIIWTPIAVLFVGGVLVGLFQTTTEIPLYIERLSNFLSIERVSGYVDVASSMTPGQLGSVIAWGAAVVLGTSFAWRQFGPIGGILTLFGTIAAGKQLMGIY